VSSFLSDEHLLKRSRRAKSKTYKTAITVLSIGKFCLLNIIDEDYIVDARAGGYIKYK
jgi:hypothetical protein